MLCQNRVHRVTGAKPGGLGKRNINEQNVRSRQRWYFKQDIRQYILLISKQNEGIDNIGKN